MSGKDLRTNNINLTKEKIRKGRKGALIFLKFFDFKHKIIHKFLSDKRYTVNTSRSKKTFKSI